VDIVAGNMREGEVHMGSFAELKISDKTFDEVQTEKPVKNKEVVEFNVGDKVVSRSFVVQAFSPRFYDANPETGKKITEEELASGAPSEKRAILNVVIDDGTENIRAVLFHEMVQKLGITESEDENLIEQQRQNILGKEMIFGGNVRMNSYFNNPELIVDSIEEVDLDKEIANLE
jgi:hypothetical protein